MEQEIKKYVCVCGREFDNPQVFNSHKGNCKIHLIQKYGSYENYLEVHNKNHDNAGIKRSQTRRNKKEKSLNDWISEKHTCENCGKVMTEKYSSGRFCCRSCANTRKHSEETKSKLSSATKNSASIRKIKLLVEYEQNPKFCSICGKTLPYDKRNRKTCSDECFKLLISKQAIDKNFGGYNPNSIKKHHKGIYKNIHCDSSWELAFLVYHLDNNIKIERCNQYFHYTYNNKLRKYYPDFIIDNKFIEIKAVITDQVKAKIDQFPNDKQLIILYKQDIMQYLSYCIYKYGNNFWETLYD